MVCVMLYLCIFCVALLMDLFVLCVVCTVICVACVYAERVMTILVEGGCVVVVSAGHVCGTRGSGILFSVSDLLGMSVVRGMGGVGGVYMCLARGGV